MKFQRFWRSKSKLATRCVEAASSRRSAHSIAKGACKAKDDVNKALMAVSREVANVSKWKVSITGSELKDGSKRVSTQI